MKMFFSIFQKINKLYVTVDLYLPCLFNLIIRHQYRGLRDHRGQDLGTDFRQLELRPGSVRPQFLILHSIYPFFQFVPPKRKL